MMLSALILVALSTQAGDCNQPGQQAYRRADYPEALRLLTLAYGDPSCREPLLYYNLALTETKLHQATNDRAHACEAARWYKALEGSGDVPMPRSEIEAKIAQMNDLCSPPVLDAGPPPEDAAASPEDAAAPLEDAAPPFDPDPYQWVALGTTTVTAAAAIVFGLLARSDIEDALDTHDPVTVTDLRDRAHTSATISNVLWSVTAAAAITTGVLFWLNVRADAHLAPVASDNSAGLLFGTSF